MRLPSSLFQQLATGRGGAIVEEGDGELLLPPVLQPVVVVGGPLFSLATLAAAIEQSSIGTGQSFVSGVAALFTTDMLTLNSGIWMLDIRWRWHFTGTTDVNKDASITIVDPNANTEELMVSGFLTGAQAHEHTQIAIALPSDGWIFRARRDATIAADVADLRATMIAVKLA